MKNKIKYIILIFLGLSLLLMMFGCMTNSKTNAIFLSDHQLYTKDKAQMFQSVSPLVVNKDHLEIHVEGTAYISSPDIIQKLHLELNDKIKNNEMCYKYIPKGLDLETIEKVLELKKHEDEAKILKAFVQYEKDLKQKKNQLGDHKLNKWIKNQNETLSKTYKCKWPEDAKTLKAKIEHETQ